MLGDVSREVLGAVSREVLGDVGNEVLGDVSREVLGDVSSEVLGDVSREVLGDVSREVLGDVNREVLGHVSREGLGDVSSKVLGDVSNKKTKTKKHGQRPCCTLGNSLDSCSSGILSGNSDGTRVEHVATMQKPVRRFSTPIQHLFCINHEQSSKQGILLCTRSQLV